MLSFVWLSLAIVEIKFVDILDGGQLVERGLTLGIPKLEEIFYDCNLPNSLST